MKFKNLFLFILPSILFSCGGVTNSNEQESSSLETIFSEDYSSINSEISSITEDTSSIEESPISSEFISTFEEKKELTYKEKLESFIDDYYIKDQDFITHIKSLEDNIEIDSNAIYVTPNGNGDGSISSPCSIYDAIWSVKSGQTIYLRGGTYNLEEIIYIESSGSKDNYKSIKNYPEEKVIITSTSENIKKYSEGDEYVLFAFVDNASYWHIEGLEFASIKQKKVGGIVFWGGGQNHIIIKDNKFHNLETSITDKNNTDAGANSILMLGETKNPINNIFIYGNECYDNVTGWSETISAAGNCEAIYVINNYVHDNTNIGIDFYGNAGYCSDPALDQPRYCIAALNVVKNSKCEYADCAGLYVDGGRDILLTNNIVYESQDGIEIGSEERQDDYPVKNIIVRNNLLYHNTTSGIRIGGYQKNETGIVKDTYIYNNTIIDNNTDGGYSEVTLAKVDGISFKNNIIYSSKVENRLVSSDFNESYTKNLIFENNYFGVNNTGKDKFKFDLYSKGQTGLDTFNSLINGNNITGEITFDEDYKVLSGVTINSGDNSLDVGLYDLSLNKRKKDNIDIGAYEL